MCKKHFWNFFVILCVFVFFYVLHRIDPKMSDSITIKCVSELNDEKR